MPNVLQVEALRKLEKFEVNNEKGVVVMPTGTGKTFLACLWFKQKLEQNPDAKLLFICHNNDILSQANEREFQKNLKDMEITYGYYNAYEKNIQQATFGTVQTLYRNLASFQERYFDYIIVDEAHHYQARTFKRVVNHFKPRFLLGLTATPYRMDNKNIFKVCGQMVYKSKINKAIKTNLLTKVVYYCVDNDIDFSKIKWNGSDYDQRDLNTKLCVKEYDEAILKEYKNLVQNEYNKTKTICFCATVRHAYRMEKYFNDNGIKAVALCGMSVDRKNTIRKKKRQKIIQDYRKGKYDVIFVRDLFNEGVDVPKADCIMLMRNTKSHTVFTQQIGRGLRNATNKESCLILDFVGNARRCEINFEVLNDMLGVDIKEETKRRVRERYTPKEMFIYSNGCVVRLNKTKINLFKKVDYSREPLNKELLEKLYFALREELGRNPTQREFQKKYKITIFKTEKTWVELQRMIGVKPDNIFSYNKEEIIEKYKECKAKLGRPPLRKEFTGLMQISKTPLRTHFGGHLKLVEMMGDLSEYNKILKESNKPRRGRYSEQELINAYNIAKEKMGRIPSLNEVSYISGITRRPFWRIFGSYKKMLDSVEKENIKIVEKYTPKTVILPREKRVPKKKGSIKMKKVDGFKVSTQKDQVRTKIISKIQDGDTVLILESPKLLALHEIEKQNIKPKKIVIPNHLEFKKVANALQCYNTKLNIELINTSVLQYLVDTEEKFDFIWLDYCGGFNYYVKDLDVLFAKKRSDIKLVLTYNIFDPLKDEKDGYYLTKVIDFVLEKAGDVNKVRLLNDITYRYKRNMYNLGFNIQKIKITTKQQ